MIMYTRALYRSFKVKWIGKVYFPIHVLFIINTVIRAAHDNVRTCVIQYSRAHKLFGHSRVFILTIMICVKRIIFSNDCISKRLKDRKLKLFSWYSSNNAR